MGIPYLLVPNLGIQWDWDDMRRSITKNITVVLDQNIIYHFPWFWHFKRFPLLRAWKSVISWKIHWDSITYFLDFSWPHESWIFYLHTIHDYKYPGGKIQHSSTNWILILYKRVLYGWILWTIGNVPRVDT